MIFPELVFGTDFGGTNAIAPTSTLRKLRTAAAIARPSGIDFTLVTSATIATVASSLTSSSKAATDPARTHGDACSTMASMSCG